MSIYMFPHEKGIFPITIKFLATTKDYSHIQHTLKNVNNSFMSLLFFKACTSLLEGACGYESKFQSPRVAQRHY